MSPEDERDERISSILDEMVGDAMLNGENLMTAIWPERITFTGAHLTLAEKMLEDSDTRFCAEMLLTTVLEDNATSAYEEEVKLAQEEDTERKADNAHYAKSHAYYDRGRNQ